MPWICRFLRYPICEDDAARRDLREKEPKPIPLRYSIRKVSSPAAAS
jgi:hypothetical protein